MSNYTKRPSRSPLRLTLADVIRREPRVVDIIRQADMVRPWVADDKLVCGEGLFQAYFKDWIASVVGWRREPDEVFDYYRNVAMTEGPRTLSNWGVAVLVHGREADEISGGVEDPTTRRPGA